MFRSSGGGTDPRRGRFPGARGARWRALTVGLAVVVAGLQGVAAGATPVRAPGGVTAPAATDLFLISPTGLDFGDVAVGTTGPTQAVTVTNVSGAPVLMNGTGGAAGVFGGSQDCQGHTLAAGASCHMYYAFTPTVLGPVTGGGGGTWNGQDFRVAMTGTGINPFIISPTGLDFGDVAVGTTGPTQAVTVTNVSGAPMLMNGTGGAAGVFGGSQDCQGHTLAAGASCHMYYAFTPTAVGPVTGGGGGTWNKQAFRIAMTGIGAATSPAPTVTQVAPRSGPRTGGTTVKITGTGFAGATAVKFGPVPARHFTVVSSTEITAVSPAEAPAVHNVQVTTPTGGTSVKVGADRFTFN